MMLFCEIELLAYGQVIVYTVVSKYVAKLIDFQE